MSSFSWAQTIYSTLLLNSNAFSLQICNNLRGNKQALQWYKIYWQEALLQQRKNQPNKHKFPYCCAKFINCLFCVLGGKSHSCSLLVMFFSNLSMISDLSCVSWRGPGHLSAADKPLTVLHSHSDPQMNYQPKSQLPFSPLLHNANYNTTCSFGKQHLSLNTHLF